MNFSIGFPNNFKSRTLNSKKKYEESMSEVVNVCSFV